MIRLIFAASLAPSLALPLRADDVHKRSSGRVTGLALEASSRKSRRPEVEAFTNRSSLFAQNLNHCPKAGCCTGPSFINYTESLTLGHASEPTLGKPY